MDGASEGILTLTCDEAELTHDTETFGSMSPYITIVFKEKKLKTKIHDAGGKKPKWGDRF